MSHPRDAISRAEAQPDADGKRKDPLKLRVELGVTERTSDGSHALAEIKLKSGI